MRGARLLATLVVAIACAQYASALAQAAEPRSGRATARPARPASEPVTDIDKLFEAQGQAGGAAVAVDATVLHSARDAASQVHEKTEAQRRERERASQASAERDGGATTSMRGATGAAGVAAIRSENYDNAGRQTSAYWIECRGGNKVRVYRSAWDGKRDWYSPAGLGTFNFIASASLSIEDVAKKVCR